ncbi:MAG: hypothetical protein J7L95_07310, partial [Prolixibacteraceae bacterium]|nr:hypothetical protein [Prolixibacteraceae bacterium]
NYLWRAPSIGSWEKAYKEGKCNATQSAFWNTKPVEELYDTEKDPWEVKNLAADPAYKDVLMRMRAANKKWIAQIYDTGFVPEADWIDRAGGVPFYDYMRSGKINLNELINAAETATSDDPENLTTLIEYLNNDDSAIRYWGATGLLILGDKAAKATEVLKHATKDSSADVISVAAEALYNLGEEKVAKEALLSVLKVPNEFARCRALNVIDCIGDKSPEMVKGVINMIKTSDSLTRNKYDIRAAKWLIEKWGLNPDEYAIDFAW